MNQDRLYSLDMMKFVAAIFITNSHFQPLYEGVNTAFATFGVQGNALFFFVAGYLLMMGFGKHKELSFIDWFKGKIRRLWPAVFIWVVVANLIWDAPLTFDKLILGSDYWFLQTIVIYYALFYLLIKVLPAKCRFWGGNKYMFYLFGLSVACSVAYFFWMPVAEGSPFHTSFHFVCHFSIMMMGAMVYVCRDRISMGHWVKDVCGMALSFVLYFLILAVGKNKTGWMYDVQVLALVPLHSFVYYGYKVASYKWTDWCLGKRFLGKGISLVAGLTLEIYIVQFMLITNKWNSVFPLNIVIVFAIICLAAYLLKVMTAAFLSLLSKDKFSLEV